MDTNIDFNLAYPQEKTESWLLWKVLKFTVKPDLHYINNSKDLESLIRSKKQV